MGSLRFRLALVFSAAAFQVFAADRTFLHGYVPAIVPKPVDLTTATAQYRPIFGVGDPDQQQLKGIARYGELTVGPGGIVSYPAEEQMYFVLEGAGVLLYDDQKFPIRRNDFMYLPVAVKHGSWNKEVELMCPANPIGAVDLLMVSYHGGDPANSPALIHALRPRVTIMNNGARKMGSPAVLKTIQSSPGLQAAYQLHWSANAPDDNPSAEFIANLPDSPDGKWIKVSAQRSGAFTVTNARTGISRSFGHLP